MKILYVAARHSPFDHNAGSGLDYDLHQGFVRNGAQVEVVGPFDVQPTLFERICRKAHRILFKLRPTKYPQSFIRKAAPEVMHAIYQMQPDVIFSKYAVILHKLKTNIPIVTLIDTTINGSHSEWPLFSPFAYWQQNHWERKTYQGASRILTHSDWSANSLVNYYQQPSEKIVVLPMPASIPAEIVPEAISPTAMTSLKLLMVGRESHRKGVDIAQEVTRLLNARGVPTKLRVVGVSGKDTKHINYMGLYNKTIPEELDAYVNHYKWANFLIHPARFEAAGIVPGEAAAFGTPTITNNVGGLGTTVADGESGIVLPKHSPAEAYVNALSNWVKDPAGYRELCHRTRKRYEKELNWGIAAKLIYQVVSDAAQGY